MYILNAHVYIHSVYDKILEFQNTFSALIKCSVYLNII